MPNPIVNVEPGVLVMFTGLGIAVRADYNPDEPSNQPFVTINTEELDATHCYGSDNGLPAIAVHLNDTVLFDDKGYGDSARLGLPDDLTVYVVRPPEPPENVAVFQHEEDAGAFACTYDELDTDSVERVLVCNRELAGEMVRERREADTDPELSADARETLRKQARDAGETI